MKTQGKLRDREEYEFCEFALGYNTRPRANEHVATKAVVKRSLKALKAPRCPDD